MAFKVSRRILNALPDQYRDKEVLEKTLWDKTGGLCFLCEDPIKRAADDYEADHDVPEGNEGDTSIENLNLAHVSCNRAKRAAGSRSVRPLLKFGRYLERVGGRIKYDGALKFFGIEPALSAVHLDGTEATFEFPDGTERRVPVFTEENEQGVFASAFVDVPRVALFNDDECQPRVIKRQQVAAIYSDLRRNPLHEPPSVRLRNPVVSGDLVELLMFDGQHKTVANWLMDRDRVVVKVYLDLTREAAIELVNSIQAKIRKLPLSPFELASKLSEEWEDKLSIYEKAVGEANASEAGFIAWLPADDRPRAKTAFKAALVQGLLSNPDLRLVNYADGVRDDAMVALTENAIRTKVLEQLIHTNPLDARGDDLTAIRTAEALNIVRLLNHLTDAAFEPSGGNEPSDVESTRAKRMSYQAALAYCASLVRALWLNVAMQSAAGAPLADELSDDQWARVLFGLDKLVDHPVWTAEATSDEMQVVLISLEKNQNFKSSFEAVALDLPYLLTGDSYPKYREVWQGP